MKLSTLGLGMILACLVQYVMSAANLVQDPGFEVGGAVGCFGSAACSSIHPSWTFVNAASGSIYGISTSFPHSGTNLAIFGDQIIGSYDVIQQSLTTMSGQFYSLSFWLDTSHHSTADFQVFWNGTMIYDDPSGTDATHQFSYTQLTFGPLQATGSSTVLQFAGYNVTSVDRFDDIVVDSAVSGVPEPGTWGLFGAGMAALALFRRRTH